MKFKVALLQMKSLNRQYQKSTDIVLEKMKEASNQKADLLLLPEVFLSGYELPMSNDEALSDENSYFTQICDMAKQLNIGIVVTTITKGINKPQNSAFVINKKGQILMKYSKVHTCDFADEICFESGNEFKVCDFHGIKIGIMICYDREYPESARVLMMKGAEIILVPNDCYAMKPRLNALSTRAYENMVGVVMANPNGENAGNSCAFSPICWDEDGNCIDNTILLVNEMSEGLFYASFDMDKIRQYRENEMMGNTYRKVKAYDSLLSDKIEYPFIRINQMNISNTNKEIRYVNESDFKLLFKYEHLSKEELNNCIKQKRILAIFNNDNLIGWLRYNLFWDEIPFINMLYILEEYRHQGYGNKILNYWEKEMMKNSYSRVMTSTLSNEKAQFFYRKNGYIDCGSLLLPQEPLEIIMMKKLSNE